MEEWQSKQILKDAQIKYLKKNMEKFQEAFLESTAGSKEKLARFKEIYERKTTLINMQLNDMSTELIFERQKNKKLMRSEFDTKSVLDEVAL